MPSSTVPVETGWLRAIALGLFGSLVIGIVALALLWPSKTSWAHDLPVSISGPSDVVAEFEASLHEAEIGDVFRFVDAEDRDEAVAQIESRASYGAFVLSDTAAPEILTSPAASAVAAQMLSAIAEQHQSHQAPQAGADEQSDNAGGVTVTTVAPFSDTDPNGSGLATAAFPLVLGGILGGVFASTFIVGGLRRLVGAITLSTATGLLLALILQTWFGYLQGSFFLNFLALGLTILAASMFIVGCRSLLGPAGIAIGAIATMFVGNPLSAAASPFQFLPSPWGTIGQHFIPGAANSLIRSLSYFPEASTAGMWLTLGAWAAVGVIFTIIGYLRSRPSSDTKLEPALEEPSESTEEAVLQAA